VLIAMSIAILIATETERRIGIGTGTEIATGPWMISETLATAEETERKIETGIMIGH
jgi:hypothetical protein